jgi:ABC-type bacteriocin/lantibiotic exporter with double-glycine peptidase domain
VVSRYSKDGIMKLIKMFVVALLLAFLVCLGGPLALVGIGAVFVFSAVVCLLADAVGGLFDGRR